MTYVPADVVEVRAWGRTVGAVVLDPTTGYYAFEYDPDWVNTGPALSPLLMPNADGTFVFPELAINTFHRLPALLADSLPDRFGNALVDSWMLEQGVRPADITALDRLAYASDRTMGSLEFHPPAGHISDDVTAIQLADLVTAARSVVIGDLTTAPKAALRDLVRVGTSAGGARAKAVIAYNPVTGEVRSGQLDAPNEFEHWLVKLDGIGGDLTRDAGPSPDGQGYGLIEFAYHLMARAAGVTMAECLLLPEGPRTHFMTRRFDRLADGERLHMQSLCGLAGLDFNMTGAHSYGQYIAAINELQLGLDAREEAFRRMVFNVAAMNRDDHTKNLAFLMTRHGEWSLAPAFDVTYAHNPAGDWTSLHQMTVEGRRDGIELDDLYRFGDRYMVPGYRQVARDVLDAVDSWPDFAHEAGVAPQIIEIIAASLASARPK